MGAYVLMNGDTGAPMALIDGTRLTLWRTAATLPWLRAISRVRMRVRI